MAKKKRKNKLSRDSEITSESLLRLFLIALSFLGLLTLIFMKVMTATNYSLTRFQLIISILTASWLLLTASAKLVKTVIKRDVGKKGIPKIISSKAIVGFEMVGYLLSFVTITFTILRQLLNE